MGHKNAAREVLFTAGVWLPGRCDCLFQIEPLELAGADYAFLQELVHCHQYRLRTWLRRLYGENFRLAESLFHSDAIALGRRRCWLSQLSFARLATGLGVAYWIFFGPMWPPPSGQWCGV